MERTRRTDARLLRSLSCLLRMERNVAVFWMRFRQVPLETDVDHSPSRTSEDGGVNALEGLGRHCLFRPQAASLFTSPTGNSVFDPWNMGLLWSDPVFQLAVSHCHHGGLSAVAHRVVRSWRFGGRSLISEPHACRYHNTWSCSSRPPCPLSDSRVSIQCPDCFECYLFSRDNTNFEPSEGISGEDQGMMALPD